MNTCIAPPVASELDTVPGNEDTVWMPVAEDPCPMTGRQDCDGADSARCPRC